MKMSNMPVAARLVTAVARVAGSYRDRYTPVARMAGSYRAFLRRLCACSNGSV